MRLSVPRLFVTHGDDDPAASAPGSCSFQRAEIDLLHPERRLHRSLGPRRVGVVQQSLHAAADD